MKEFGMRLIDKAFTDTEQMIIKNMKKFAAQVTHKTVSCLRPSDFFFAGGMFASLAHNETVRDIDVFVTNAKKHQALFILSLQGDLKVNNEQVYITDSRYFMVFDDQKSNYPFQYISNPNTNNTRESVISSFDFEHAKVSYDPSKLILYISPLTLDCILRKKLYARVPKSKINPNRINKFFARGWTWHEDYLVSENYIL